MTSLAGTHPRRRAGITVRTTPGGAGLFEDGREVCVLNATALALWELCDGNTTPEEIVTAVCEVCAVPRETAEQDVARTLRELISAGLLI